MSRNLSQISREIISRGAYPLSSQSNLECKKRVGRQHTTFTLCQNATCSGEYFLLQADYALEESTFWLSKLVCEFYRLFHAGGSRHAYWFSEVIVSGRHDWWFALHCGYIRVLGCLIFSKSLLDLNVMVSYNEFCHAGPRSFSVFARC